jgi:hypothetical protein
MGLDLYILRFVSKELKSLLNFKQLGLPGLTPISLCFIHSEIMRNRETPIGVYHCVI